MDNAIETAGETANTGTGHRVNPTPAELAADLHGQVEWTICRADLLEDAERAALLEEAGERIREPGCLGELCEVLVAYEEIDRAAGGGDHVVRLEDACDITGLPDYGGPEPASTDQVYSWDEADVLVNTGGGWLVTERD